MRVLIIPGNPPAISHVISQRGAGVVTHQLLTEFY